MSLQEAVSSFEKLFVRAIDGPAAAYLCSNGGAIAKGEDAGAKRTAYVVCAPIADTEEGAVAAWLIEAKMLATKFGNADTSKATLVWRHRPELESEHKPPKKGDPWKVYSRFAVIF